MRRGGLQVSIVGFSFFVAAWSWLAGCGARECQDGFQLQSGMCVSIADANPSCLDSALSTERANADKTEYDFLSPHHAVDAMGVRWLDIPDNALFLNGDEASCFVGGYVDGPYPEDACYECSSKHCPGSCPAPGGYHSTAALAPTDSAGSVIEDVHIKDYGDGISVESSSGDVVARRVWFQDLHDDAMETDFAHQSLSCVDCLFERVFMVLAFARRSSAAGNTPIPGWTAELRNSLVQVHRFTNAYEQSPGTGGVVKDDPSVTPTFRFTNNVFLQGPVARSGRVQFPAKNHTAECSGNVMLWQGTQSAYNDMLATGRGLDAGSNGERLSWLNRQFPGCYRIVVKRASESQAEFLARDLSELGGVSWNDKVATWKSSHVAGGP